MTFNDYAKKMPNYYKKVLETIHVPENHPMFHKYVDDSLWKYYYGDELTDMISAYIDLKGVSILDIGAGAGGIAAGFAKKGANVIATDVDRGYQQLSLIGYQDWGIKVESMLCDGQMLPYKDKSFDIIICFNIFEHVPDVRLLFKEISRVLKPGGFVIGRADYKYNIRNIMADPHYGLPLIILMPRLFRKVIVVNIFKRSYWLDDVVWAKNFNDIYSRFKNVSLISHPYGGDFTSIKYGDTSYHTPGTGIIDFEKHPFMFSDGWYNYEHRGLDDIIRWSTANSVIKLLPLTGFKRVSFEALAPDSKLLEVSIGKVKYKYNITPAWTKITFDLPEGNVDIKLHSMVSKIKGDPRDLGIAIKNVKLEF